MNLVREHINEKFTEDSDPIYDLNIGIIKDIREWIRNYTYRKGRILHINDFVINDDLTIDVYDDFDISWEDITRHPSYIKFNHIHGRFACCPDLYSIKKNGPKEVDDDYVIYYNTYKGKPCSEKTVRKYCKIGGIVKFIEYGMRLVREHINEKFTQDSDPIKDMGIGTISLSEIAKKTIQKNTDTGKEQWSVYLKSIIGKKITGKFYSGFYIRKERKLKEETFIIFDVYSYFKGTEIILISDKGAHYVVDNNERYVIR